MNYRYVSPDILGVQFDERLQRRQERLRDEVLGYCSGVKEYFGENVSQALHSSLAEHDIDAISMLRRWMSDAYDGECYGPIPSCIGALNQYEGLEERLRN